MWPVAPTQRPPPATPPTLTKTPLAPSISASVCRDHSSSYLTYSLSSALLPPPCATHTHTHTRGLLCFLRGRSAASCEDSELVADSEGNKQPYWDWKSALCDVTSTFVTGQPHHPTAGCWLRPPGTAFFFKLAVRFAGCCARFSTETSFCKINSNGANIRIM